MGVFDVYVQFVPAGEPYRLKMEADDRLSVTALNVEHAIEQARRAIRECWECSEEGVDPSVRIVVTNVALARVLDA